MCADVSGSEPCLQVSPANPKKAGRNITPWQISHMVEIWIPIGIFGADVRQTKAGSKDYFNRLQRKHVHIN